MCKLNRNGEKRILFFLDDLRVDDIIVVEYTVIGTNPALLGQYSFRLRLRHSVPVERSRYRLVWDAEIPVFYQARNSGSQPEVTHHEDRVEYAWSVPPQPASKYEDQTPIDFNDRPYLEVSSSKDWAAVVDWGLETYKALDDPLEPDDYKELIKLVLQAATWCPYMLISKRVKGTFVH